MVTINHHYYREVFVDVAQPEPLVIVDGDESPSLIPLNEHVVIGTATYIVANRIVVIDAERSRRVILYRLVQISPSFQYAELLADAAPDDEADDRARSRVEPDRPGLTA